MVVVLGLLMVFPEEVPVEVKAPFEEVVRIQVVLELQARNFPVEVVGQMYLLRRFSCFESLQGKGVHWKLSEQQIVEVEEQNTEEEVEGPV